MNINFNPVSHFITIVALCLFVFQSASAQKAAAPSARQIAAKVDEYMKSAVEVERFSGSILVARDGKVIVSKSYGMANVELDVPNKPNTVFRLASITKQFTASAIMMLQERGKLNTGDSICKHLTDCPAVWQPITIRHLLTMTSGIAGASLTEIGPPRGLPVPHDQWLEATKKKPLAFTPGEMFRYNNSGYTLLGLIIERVSGKSYGEFLQENIFTPLGMKQTGYEDPRRIIKNRATGYRQLPGDPITNVPYAEIFALYAAGGIYSTTEDMLLWDKTLYTEKILTRKSIDEMFTPFKEMLPGKSYAYGWWTSKKFDRQEIAHGGNLAGFITYIARFPSERVTVIVLSNNGRGSSGKISNVLSAIVFGAPYEIPRERKAIAVATSVLDKYVGQYRIQLPPTNFTITNENGKLMALRDAEPKVEMFAESETKFFLKNEDVQFTFVKNANGEVTGLIVDQGDGTLFEVMTGQKIK
jgi:CubicO group peptidase (beta-lactamase class C family)